MGGGDPIFVLNTPLNRDIISKIQALSLHLYITTGEEIGFSDVAADLYSYGQG